MENPQVSEGAAITIHSNNRDSAGVTDQGLDDDDEDDVSECAGHPSLCQDGESVARQQPRGGSMRKQASDWLPQDSFW